MVRFIFCIIICFFSSNNYCYASESLVLSDVIKEARETAQQEEIKTNEQIKPVREIISKETAPEDAIQEEKESNSLRMR